MFWNDDEKKIKTDNNDRDKDDYKVPSEEIKTVFSDQKDKVEIDDAEQNAPQHKSDYKVQSQLIVGETEQLAPITISKEMRKSFLEYAMSVIVERALPNAKDGLKPVHRRILYGMHELGLTANSQHKKSARIVGDVLGKYHPHGDASVYDAMVRLAQDFSMRYPMIDGHGNFGSIDGDGAAAMRYTEARMSKIATTMVDSIRKNTVDFGANYDGSEQEPIVLPSRIPNLLVSGSTGIAVGMATNIAPHNLQEIIDGVIAFAKNNDITIEDLATIIKGPDFPTGGIIVGSSGIIEAYKTGKGAIKVRSKTHIEELKNGKNRIIITEIPYMVNKSRMVEKIAQLVKDKAIEGITDLRDETSRSGIRVVIELRKDVVPEVVQNQLFKMTQLQTNFSMNMIALVDGEPKKLNLKTALSIYFKHQCDVVTRRTKFDLDKAVAREHILRGLKIAVKNIEGVIKTIRSSQSDENAQQALRSKYSFSEKQAKAITDMRLGRLTGLATAKMDEELLDLTQIIKELDTILNDSNVLTNLIISELEEIKSSFGDLRRTEVNNALADIDDEDLIPQKDIVITMSNRGYVKRIPVEEYQVQNRGGIGSKGMSTYEDDSVEKIITTNTHTDLLIFTTYGKVYRVRSHQIPELSKQAKGIPFVNIINIQKDEKIVSLLSVEKYNSGEYLLTVTKKGVVKKTVIEAYSRINRNGKIALKMRDDDMLVKAMIVNDNLQIIIGGSHGKVVRFDSTKIRSIGRTSTGVRGINLSARIGAKVVGASVTNGQNFILSIGEDGFGKMTSISEYRQTNRGAKGVKSINTKKAGYLKFVEVVKGDEDILILTQNGIAIRTSLSQIATSSRSAKGVKIISLKNNNKIKSIAIIDISAVKEKVDEAIRRTQKLNLQNLQKEN